MISAFDLHHALIPKASNVARVAEVTFVDSGGYETGATDDLSPTVATVLADSRWTREVLFATLDKWPKHEPAVFVTFDDYRRRKGTAAQLTEASLLKARYPDQMIDFLLKPEKKSHSLLNLDLIEPLAEKLKPFEIIGVTEKEIGNSPTTRIKNIVRLRKMLDQADVKSPIHIFGSLDPLSSWLYFLAGAEIFDGLTWLRYGYADGLAVYKQNYGVLHGKLQLTDDALKRRSIIDNHIYLMDLQQHMRTFAKTHDFSCVEHHRQVLVDAWRDLSAATRSGG